MPFLNLLDSMGDKASESYWVNSDDVHPNAEAHGRFAQAIFSGFDWNARIPAR